MHRLYTNTSIVLLLVAAVLSGCTTMQPVNAPSDEVQKKLLTTGFVKPGDRIRIGTFSGHTYEMTVQRTDELAIISETGEQVLIQDIEVLHIRQFSFGKSATLAGGVFSVLAFVAVAIAVPVVF